MTNKQETLIYIEKDSITEAQFMSRNFVDKEIRNRAYINTLAGELFMKYLQSEGIDVNNVYNMRSVSKILESTDISDVRLSNIHIDVRAVFNKKHIFIPKAHFELGITPDVYVVLFIDEDFKQAELLGYFTPDKINKENENSKYYFIDPAKLSPAETLANFIKTYQAKTSETLTTEDIFRGRELSVLMADHNLSLEQEIEFFSLLSKSSQLRESIIEFDNFETLAYNTVEEVNLLNAEDTKVQEEQAEVSETTPLENIEPELLIDEINIDNSPENNNEPDNSFIDDLTEAVEEAKQDQDQETELQSHTQNSSDTENAEEEAGGEDLDLTLNIDELALDDLNITENLTLDIDDISSAQLPEDNSELPQIDNPDIQKPETSPSSQTKDEDKGNAIAKTAEAIGKAAGAAGVIAAAGAMSAAAAENAAIQTTAAATNEVIKLAGVAGESISNIIESNIESQQQNLDKIDYTKTPEINHKIPENISGLQYSTNVSTEEIDEYHTPTDLNNLKTVEDHAEEQIQPEIQQETIDLPQMDNIQTETYNENTETVVDINDINVQSPTKPIDNLEEVLNNSLDPNDVIDLPDISTFTIEETQNDNTISEENIFDDEQIADEGLNSNNFENNNDINNPEFENTDIIIEEDAENLLDELEQYSNENLDNLQNENSDENDNIIVENTSEISEEIPEDNLEDIISSIENSDEIITDQNSNIELDDEFSTDLNTEADADEAFHDVNPAQEFENDPIIENNTIDNKNIIMENSIVISDKTFKPGEIPIDINIQNQSAINDNEPLGEIYDNSENQDSSMLYTPGTVSRATDSQSGAKSGLKVLAGLIMLAVVCVIGFYSAKMFKTPTEEAPQPLDDNTLPTDTVDESQKTQDNLNINPDNVLKMDNNTNALLNTKTPAAKTQTSPVASAKKSISATSFIEVKKLTWEVPDYISYYPQFKQYFQAAGKSLKLSLTSDLLLATDLAYTNEVKVSTTFNKDGSFKNAQILKSSGSSQIDKIVLQTVNQTLKVLKAPPSVNNDESTTAILKIYF